MLKISRRQALAGLGTLGAASAFAFPAPVVRAQSAPIKVGLMLPYSGTYAALGEAITNGITMRIEEAGSKWGGRPVTFVKVDDESAPPKATALASRLIDSEKVDFLVGTVHSGVAMGMAKIAREAGTITVIPNAGADAITRQFCAPNLFRSSFSNWQPPHPMGKVLLERGLKRVAVCYWDYGAGQESTQGFRDGFEPHGGEIVGEFKVPFPTVEFQAVLTQIAALEPDAVFVFFAGGGAVKFVLDYAAAGLKDKIPLVSSGFLTEGTTEAQGAAAEGLMTTLHYADGLTNAQDKPFRAAYLKAFGKDADVYAVQGYDAGTLLAIGLEAVKGDAAARGDMIAAMEKADFASPRGPFRLSPSHNPVQNFYLRQVMNGKNQMVGVAMEMLSDPGTGCSMG